MKPWAEQFYNSDAWRSCRDAFLQSKGYLCERCSTPDDPVAAKNPYDVQPVWEDCTNAVISGLAHVFENTTNTATQFGLNIRVTVERGDALTACWVSGIGGNFE